MFHRLCKSPSIPLSFNLAAVLPRRISYRVNLASKRVDTPQSERSSFRAWTTGVSNPIRDPRFRVSASGVDQSFAFAFGVPHDINAFHRYTMSSRDPYHPLSLAVSRADSRLSRKILRETNKTAYTPFTPNDSG